MANDLMINNFSWSEMRDQAGVMLKSGFLPSSIKTAEQALTIMLKGRELNIPPMEALSGINIIQGKPSVSPQLMLALARRTRELEDIQIVEESNKVKVTIKRKNQTPVTTVFGDEEAKDLQLSGKDNYKKQPLTMYRWRALAANLRLTFTDAISGLYLIEEMSPDTAVNEDGIPTQPIKDITPQKPETTASPIKPTETKQPETHEKTLLSETLTEFEYRFDETNKLHVISSPDGEYKTSDNAVGDKAKDVIINSSVITVKFIKVLKGFKLIDVEKAVA